MKRLALVLALALVPVAGFAAPQKQAFQLCHWGGNVAAPTGIVTIERGLTLTPSVEATAFTATGSLAGGGRCNGTMTFEGTILAGSTCEHAWFDGKVNGLKGVSRFNGPGVLGLVHEFLYDKRGNIVGADQPVIQVPQPDGYSHAQDCATPDGFTKAVFSATVELWG